MKKIEVIVKPNNEERFEVVDQKGTVYSTCSRKYDAKRAATKNDSLILVEEFTKDEPKKVETKARQTGKLYETYKTFIMQNFEGEIIVATGDYPKSFCETFGLKLSSKKRSLTFERVLEKMADDGILELYRDDCNTVRKSDGDIYDRKYKRIAYQFVTTDDEEL